MHGVHVINCGQHDPVLAMWNGYRQRWSRSDNIPAPAAADVFDRTAINTLATTEEVPAIVAPALPSA